MRKIVTKDIVIKQIKKKWLLWLWLIVCIICDGLIIGFGYVEALRRISDSIWSKNPSALTNSIVVLLTIIAAQFLLTNMRSQLVFAVKKNLVFTVEDLVYDYYSASEYWIRKWQDDMVGKMKKVVPDAMDTLVKQICSTCRTIIVVISGCLYGLRVNANVLCVALVAIVVLVAICKQSKKQIAPLYQEFREHTSKVYNLLCEQVKNREIAVFLNREKVLKNFQKESREYLKALLHVKKATNGAGLFAQFGNMILIVLVSLIGGITVLEKGLGYAELLAMIMLIQTLSSYFFAVPELIQSWKTTSGNCKSIDLLFDAIPCKRKGDKKLEEKIEQIELRNMSYAYMGAERNALENVNLVLESGKFYALAGASGCGKSTLLHIIARLIPDWKGSILINSDNLKSLEQQDFWKHLILVKQFPVIVPGSLLYNITLDEKQFDRNRLIQAIKDAALENYVGTNLERVFTHVTSDQLSKGEAKKVNIARAFYHNAEVIVFDEMTEGLDPESEVCVLNAIKRRVTEGALIICASHKLETLKTVNKVILLKDGKIECVASHETILSNNENYRTLLGEVTT